MVFCISIIASVTKIFYVETSNLFFVRYWIYRLLRTGVFAGARDYSKMHVVASVAVIFLAATYYAAEVLIVRDNSVLLGDLPL